MIGAILALDLGTTMGWALQSDCVSGGIVSGVEDHRQNRWSGGGLRYLRFRDWLVRTHAVTGGLGLVVYEEVRRHAGTDAAHVYGGFLAHLTAWGDENNIPYEGVPVGTIKRFATGKGNASKADVILSMRARGHQPADDNEADALAILHWALANRKEAVGL